MPQPTVILPKRYKTQAAADKASKAMAQKLGVSVGAYGGPSAKAPRKSPTKKKKASPAKRKNPAKAKPVKRYVIRSNRIGVALPKTFFKTKDAARAAAKRAAKRTGFGVAIKKVQVLKGAIVG